MNPGGVVEEAGTTARTVVEAMKSTPAMLCLIIFNLIFLGAVVYLVVNQGNRLEREISRWHEIADSAIKACGPK